MNQQLTTLDHFSMLDQFKDIGNQLVVTLTAEIPAIAQGLEEKYPTTAIPEDLSAKDNYKLVEQAIRDIKAPRLNLEKNRKQIKETPFQICKQIDDAARP